MRKSVLLTISLSLAGCGSLPKFPEVWQCSWNGNPRAFFCINTETRARMKIDATSPDMRGAQCLSHDDYRKSEEWVATVKEIAEKRCR